MTEKETKARYALALFMKTDARISTFIKAKLGISLYFGFGNPYFKELLIDKKVHENIVKEIFELNSSNIAFLHDNIMTSNERKAFSKVRNSFVGMPKASIKLDKLHAHAIFVWFSELIAEKGFLIEYQNIVNELIADKRILDSAEKVYDAKVVSHLKPEPIDYSGYIKIPQQTVPAPIVAEQPEPEVTKELNPNNLVPTDNMMKLKTLVKNHTEFLQVYEGLLTKLYDNDYSAGDVPKLIGINANAVLYFMEHVAKLETKKARDECIARIRAKSAKLVPVAKERIYAWKHEGTRYVVDDETYKIITHWEEVMEIEKLISELPKKHIFPTNTMKVLKENSPTAVKYLFNYSGLIMDLRSIFGLKNTQIAGILNVSPSQLSGFLSSYYKGKVPAISYRSDVSSALDRGEITCELSSYVFEWECEHLKSTQTINPMPTAKTKINEPQLSMFEPLPELPEIEEPVVATEPTFEQKIEAIKSPHITKNDIEEFNGCDNSIDPNFEKDPEKEPSEFVRESVKSASNELNMRLEQEIINRFRDPERGKRIIEMLKSGLVGTRGVPDLGITCEDLKTLEELHEEQNARLNAFLESKRQEALKWLQPEPAPEPETPSTAKVVEEAMKNVLPEPVKPETPNEVYTRAEGFTANPSVNPFNPYPYSAFGTAFPSKENPFVDHETVRQAMSGNQQGFNYIPYGYAGPSPAPDVPANINTIDHNPQEEYNMAVDERPYPPIGGFPRTPFPTNNNTVRYAYKLIIPKRYFNNKESEELIRDYFNSIDYYSSTPNEVSNTSLRVGFRLGLIFNSMDKNEKEKILNFIEAIEEEYPDAFKLSDILKGGV